MHGLGIAHRDIKPENLLVAGNGLHSITDLIKDFFHLGILKISDFGMATMFKYNGIQRDMTSYCGTLPYMAPEVFRSTPYK